MGKFTELICIFKFVTKLKVKDTNFLHQQKQDDKTKIREAHFFAQNIAGKYSEKNIRFESRKPEFEAKVCFFFFF